MGYLSSGFAFGSPPDWEAVRPLFDSFAIRGYRSKESAVSLLDVWRPTRNNESRYPFTTGPIEPKHISHPMPASPATGVFDDICNIVRGVEHVEYTRDWLCIPALLSSATRLKTFAFTADDDVFDYGALADAGSVVRMGCKIGMFAIAFDGSGFQITPHIGEDQEEPMEGDEELFAELSALEHVQVLPRRTAKGGSLIYQNPCDVWPAQWGDAEKLLGFGTFDPFEDLMDNFDVVFEHVPTRRPTAKTRAWWKLW